jgi:hypothetical protein
VQRLTGMVDVVVRRLTGVVDEDNAVEVIVRPEDETHDGEQDRHSKVVETYFRSAIILRPKTLYANNSMSQKIFGEINIMNSS